MYFAHHHISTENFRGQCVAEIRATFRNSYWAPLIIRRLPAVVLFTEYRGLQRILHSRLGPAGTLEAVAEIFRIPIRRRIYLGITDPLHGEFYSLLMGW